jgi:hypothetical protein
MVKIEQLKDAKAVFTRDGAEHPVLLSAILTKTEFDTIRVLQGTVVASIDEAEVVYLSVKETPKSLSIKITDVILESPQEPLKSSEPSGESLVTASEKVNITETVKPVIVKPPLRKVK